MKNKITVNYDVRNVPINGLCENNVFPYMGVQYDLTVDYVIGGKFRIISYQAFNAMGLIGSECNGIAIFNEDKRDVLLTEHKKQSSGYFGASKEQFDEIDRIVSMTWPCFKKFVNENPCCRYII